jgi:hypothetical protein
VGNTIARKDFTQQMFTKPPIGGFRAKITRAAGFQVSLSYIFAGLLPLPRDGEEFGDALENSKIECLTERKHVVGLFSGSPLICC